MCYRGSLTTVNKWSQWNLTDTYSGADAPTASGNKIWYDTSTNLIKEINDGTIDNWTVLQTSFPLCRFSATPTAVTDITQVFNGFGYIGSTVFALPGVRGLISNGRGLNGNYKNLPMSIEAIKTYTFDSSYTDIAKVWVDSEGNFTGFNNKIVYDGRRNEVVYSVDNSQRLYLNAGVTNVVEGKITEFNKSYVPSFNTYLTNEIASMSMPSNKYINLTLGAALSTYVAPANGWFTLRKRSNGAGQIVEIANDTSGTLTFRDSETNADKLGITSCPARAGDVVTINYTTGGDTTIFRFIYAQGEQ